MVTMVAVQWVPLLQEQLLVLELELDPLGVAEVPVAELVLHYSTT
jgi:hypothetical protein